mmetsp:Transcript_3262/g.7741  ORF Transcript_3262/g.7741 Transcript_3262/m.7741 type:complete len:117 (+) Transcript_3262:775-1125(+)
MLAYFIGWDVSFCSCTAPLNDFDGLLVVGSGGVSEERERSLLRAGNNSHFGYRLAIRCARLCSTWDWSVDPGAKADHGVHFSPNCPDYDPGTRAGNASGLSLLWSSCFPFIEHFVV